MSFISCFNILQPFISEINFKESGNFQNIDLESQNKEKSTIYEKYLTEKKELNSSTKNKSSILNKKLHECKFPFCKKIFKKKANLDRHTKSRKAHLISTLNYIENKVLNLEKLENLLDDKEMLFLYKCDKQIFERLKNKLRKKIKIL